MKDWDAYLQIRKPDSWFVEEVPGFQLSGPRRQNLFGNIRQALGQAGVRGAGVRCQQQHLRRQPEGEDSMTAK